MEEKIYHIIVKLTCKVDSDIDKIMADCDYSIKHEDIIDTELMGDCEMEVTWS